MISLLKGKFEAASCSESIVLMSEGGVGYEVFVSKRFVEDQITGSQVSLWIHTHVKEDSLSLYGFESKDERDFFRILISVNGIGPKSAANILSTFDWELIVSWIKKGDSKSLTTLPKVGKKTAEMLVINLKDKFEKFETNQEAQMVADLDNSSPLFSVLRNLGFQSDEISEVSTKVDQTKPIEEQVRESLAMLR